MKYDVIIIGAGPAGYVAAIRAGQLGMKTALVEKKYIGGMCLNWGCIPTKSYIESAKFYNRIKNAGEFGIDGIDRDKLTFNWEQAKKRSDRIVKKLTKGVQYLLKKNNVEIIEGAARITTEKSVNVNNRHLETKHILIATGSYPEKLQWQTDENLIIDLEAFPALEKLPENPVLTGTGGVVLEMAQFFRLIDKNVTVLVQGDDILPGADRFLKDFIVKKLKSSGIPMIYDKKVQGYESGELILDGERVKGDRIVNCSFRKAVLPPADINLELSENGFIKTGNYLETNHTGIYAIGDVNGRSYLAHAASAQGMFAVNRIAGIKGEPALKDYPINIYTHPEMAQIGNTEAELQEMNVDYKISEFPLSANGKALIEGEAEGVVRILSEKKYGEVLGVHIIAPNATDMIAEAAAFKSVEATIYDVAKTIHAHPTISEVFMEAGLEGAGNK